MEVMSKVVGGLGVLALLPACAGQAASPPATVVVTQTATAAPAPAPTVTVTAPAPTPTAAVPSTPTAEPTSEQPERPAGVRVGKPQDVGPMSITLEEIEEIPSSSGQKIVELWFRVENNDNRSIEPFCGGSNGVIVDSEGREFEGDSLIEDYTLNCGDDLNPGLDGYPYVTRFTVPDDAKVAQVRAWGDYDYGDQAGTWVVK